MDAHVVQGAAAGPVEPGGVRRAVLEIFRAAVANVGVHLHNLPDAAVGNQLFGKADVVTQHVDR